LTPIPSPTPWCCYIVVYWSPTPPTYFTTQTPQPRTIATIITTETPKPVPPLTATATPRAAVQEVAQLVAVNTPAPTPAPPAEEIVPTLLRLPLPIRALPSTGEPVTAGIAGGSLVVVLLAGLWLRTRRKPED